MQAISTNAVPVTWYSINSDLCPVDQGVLTQQAALAIVDEYIAKLGERWESGETALAETLFGFERGKGVMLEICIHKPQHISCTFEITLPRKILFCNIPKIIRIDHVLSSVDELKHSIARFFELAPEQFLAYEKRLKA